MDRETIMAKDKQNASTTADDADQEATNIPGADEAVATPAGSAAEANVRGDEAAAAADAAVEPKPAEWQHPDYAGPLDCAQAAWRNRHLKPVREVTTK